jgi:SAM-dependent methyltransferase
MARTLRSSLRLTPSLHAGLTQLAATVVAILPVLAGLEVTLAQWAVVQGAVAMRIAMFGGAARWWLPLHLSFAPAVVWAQGLAVAPVAWAAAFALLALVFGSTFRTQVPLFLTGRAVRARLGELLPQDRSIRFVDLGCGLGTVIAGLKKLRPECEFHGVELAPLPFVVSRMLAGRVGCDVRRQDIMAVDLRDFDVVYAFLSPAPMPELWAKAKREMRPGSLFVSLAFEVPGVEPGQILPVSGRARHTLYLWRM